MIARIKRTEPEGRFLTGGRRVRDSTNFSQQREDWELAVFRDATHYTVVHHTGKTENGGPAWDRQEFPIDEFPAAVEAANLPTTNGKPRLLYAVTDVGRQICLDRADREVWLTRWKESR